MAWLGGILLHLLWQGMVIGIMTAIALRLTGPAASGMRYRLALAGLVLIGIAPFATMARRTGLLSHWGRRFAPMSSQVSESPVASPIASQPDNYSKPGNPAGGSETGPSSQNHSGRTETLGWLGIVWVAGAGLLLLRLGHGVIRVHRIRALARPAPAALGELARGLSRSMRLRRAMPVLLCDRAEVPFASGVSRPVVVLPRGLAAELTPGQIRAVLAHEMAHVRRHDYLVNLGQRLLEALFFFHPAVHWLSRVARDEREHCCDEQAAAVLGDRRAIAGALLALEEGRGRTGVHSLIPAAAGGSLLGRVERLLGHPPPGSRQWAAAALPVLLAGGGTMVLATPAALPAPETQPILSAPAAAGAVVWSGALREGDRLRVRNIVGSIRVVPAAGSTGVIRASFPDGGLSGLTFQASRQDDGVTVCALRAAYGRCDAEGYTWFGAPQEMHRARIELTVELPEGSRVTAATFQGDLDLVGVSSDAEARTGSGAIAARIVDSPVPQADRTLDLHTGDGMVRVMVPPGFGGDLTARLAGRGVQRSSLGPGGNRLRVSSGNGDLILTRG